MKYKKEPSCKKNALLTCSTRKGCRECGWYGPEIKRRKALMKVKGLKEGKDGKLFLALREGDE